MWGESERGVDRVGKRLVGAVVTCRELPAGSNHRSSLKRRSIWIQLRAANCPPTVSAWPYPTRAIVSSLMGIPWRPKVYIAVWRSPDLKRARV